MLKVNYQREMHILPLPAAPCPTREVADRLRDCFMALPDKYHLVARGGSDPIRTDQQLNRIIEQFKAERSSGEKYLRLEIV